jgi:hypothetical protein
MVEMNILKSNESEQVGGSKRGMTRMSLTLAQGLSSKSPQAISDAGTASLAPDALVRRKR